MQPLAEYEARLTARRATLATATTRDAWVANLRLLVAVAAIGVAVAAFGYRAVEAVWLWPCAGAFLVLVALHIPVLAAKRAARRAVAFYERGIDRLQDRWREHGRRGEGFADRKHPYAADFDVFGPASLFQRLAVVQTRTGEETLARWLLAPPPLAVGRAHQLAAQELSPQLDVREALAVEADTAPSLSVGTLGAWGEAAPAKLGGAAARYGLLALAAASGGTAVAWLAFDRPWQPFGGALILVVLATNVLKGRAGSVSRALTEPLSELKALVPVLAMLERAVFSSPPLKEIQARVRGNTLASVAIARLARRVDWFESRRNQLFAPVAYILLWEPLFAFAFEAWRQLHGRALRGWLDAAGEIEALHALGTYTFEQPDDVFPELTDAAGVFEAEGLGHPLLAKSVRNDVTLPRVLLVSGSNMSGKSTLLRSIGTNALLALIGAPVRATRMRISWCSLGATLRVEDSLQDGASRFFAEVQRLKQLVDLAQEKPPLLFLLDEIMGGTNSHDRRVGTEALIKLLVKRGAFGVVTTHDLALTEIAPRLGSLATNVHFEDQMVDERLAFDYRMRPGVVQKSNALALMRAAGLQLEVEDAQNGR